MLRASLFRLAALVMCVCGAALPASALAADGDLDPSFGAGGRVTMDRAPGAGAEGVTTFSLLPGGSFLATGPGAGNGTWTVRHGPDGAIDPTYGNNFGSFVTFPAYSFTSQTVALPDGSLISGGGIEVGSDFDSLIFKVTPAGVLDPTFGNDAPHPTGDGVSQIDFGGDDDVAGVALQGNGVLLTGRVGPSGNYSTLLARLNPDGSRDTSFGPPGSLIDIGGNDEGTAMQVMADGRIVIAGTSGGAPYVARFTASGALDPTFGTDGVVRSVGGLASGEPSDILLDAGGNILVIGSQGPGRSAFAARLLPDGATDTGFGAGGLDTFAPNVAGNERQIYLNSVVQMDDGTLVLAGTSDLQVGGDRIQVTRLLSDGQPDPSWGGTGTRYYGGSATVYDDAFTLAALPGRRLLIGGDTYDGTNDQRTILRLLADTTPPDTAITSGPRGKITPRKSASFRFAATNDVNVTFECKVQRPRPKRHKGKRPKKPKKPVFAPCSSPKKINGLKRPGKYTLLVLATDPAGNVEVTPAKRTFRVAPRKHKHHHKHH